MEDYKKYGLVRQHSGIWKSLREREDGDFDEEDVWSVLKDSPGALNPKDKVPSNIVPNPKPTSRIMIPRPNIHESNNKVLQQSAPVNIPDWSKIYRNNNKVSKINVPRFGDFYGSDEEFEEDIVEDDDEYEPKLPPHELIAKRLARTQISSFSVLEGVGRTLKGRDLSKVRNAVLSKTGFLESH